jgi:hypothetical protein
LAGYWKGQGEVLRKGKVRNITYWDETEFKVIARGPDAVVYRVQQYSGHAQRGVPMQTENGLIKILNVEIDGNGLKVEAGFRHPFLNSTINEMTFGILDEDQELLLEAPNVENFQWAIPAEGNNQMTGYKRAYRRDGDTLTYSRTVSLTTICMQT